MATHFICNFKHKLNAPATYALVHWASMHCCSTEFVQRKVDNSGNSDFNISVPCQKVDVHQLGSVEAVIVAMGEEVV